MFMDGRSGVTRIASAEMERWVGRRCGEIFWVLERVVSGIVRGCTGGLGGGVQDLPTIVLLFMLLNSPSSTGLTFRYLQPSMSQPSLSSIFGSLNSLFPMSFPRRSVHAFENSPQHEREL